MKGGERKKDSLGYTLYIVYTKFLKLGQLFYNINRQILRTKIVICFDVSEKLTHSG